MNRRPSLLLTAAVSLGLLIGMVLPTYAARTQPDYQAQINALNARVTALEAAVFPSPTPKPTPVSTPAPTPVLTPTPSPTVAPTPAPSATTRVTSIAALLTALADNRVTDITVANGTYLVPDAASHQATGLWIDQRFASRTNPVLVHAETLGGVTFSGGGATGWSRPRLPRRRPRPDVAGLPVRQRRADPDRRHRVRPERERDSRPRHTGSVCSTSPSRSPSPPATPTRGGRPCDLLQLDHDPDARHRDRPPHGQGVHERSGLGAALLRPARARRRPPERHRVAHDGHGHQSGRHLLGRDRSRTSPSPTRRSPAPSSLAVRYEQGGTVTLRNVTSTSSGQQGFYSSLGASPSGVTFINDSLH